MSLPHRFAKLSSAAQLLAAADAERVSRGLPAALGLTRRLDAAAHAAAVAQQDPLGPSGYSWGSNWAGGSRFALFADFVWMYDDGPGAENGDCLHAGNLAAGAIATTSSRGCQRQLRWERPPTARA